MADEKHSYVVAKNSPDERDYVNAVKASNVKPDSDTPSEAETIANEWRSRYPSVAVVSAVEFERKEDE